jgi:hypothetical protein
MNNPPLNKRSLQLFYYSLNSPGAVLGYTPNQSKCALTFGAADGRLVCVVKVLWRLFRNAETSGAAVASVAGSL